MSDFEEVRRANLAMYRAFESLRIERMDEAWAHGADVSCVHPGWPLASGWPEVRRSWETIFRHTETIAFEIADERIDVRGDLAWVVCFENIRAGSGSGTVIATNVLRREKEGWRIVHHHASSAPPPRTPAPPPASKKPLN